MSKVKSGHTTFYLNGVCANLFQLNQVFKTGHTLTCHHIPTGENWLILAVHRESGKCFAAGYPPTVAKISDCTDWELAHPLEKEEISHIKKHFRYTID